MTRVLIVVVLVWVVVGSLLGSSGAQGVTSGLVAWYPLTDATDVAPVDISGNGYMAGLEGGTANPTATTGCPSGLAETCLSFDGDDRVTTPITTAFTDFTVCVWFNPTSASGNARLLDKTYGLGFWLGYNGDTQWGGGVLGFGVHVDGFPFGNWHHICQKREGTTHTIYGNRGALTTSETVSGAAINTDPLYIGASAGGSYFVGKLAHVQVYSRALSTAEMQAVYDFRAPASLQRRRMVVY